MDIKSPNYVSMVIQHLIYHLMKIKLFHGLKSYTNVCSIKFHSKRSTVLPMSNKIQRKKKLFQNPQNSLIVPSKIDTHLNLHHLANVLVFP